MNEELGTSEHKSIHLGENASQMGDPTGKSFSFEVTSNLLLPQLPLRTQAKNKKLRAEFVKEDIMLALKEGNHKELEVTFPATDTPKPSDFLDVLKHIYHSSPSAKTADLITHNLISQSLAPLISKTFSQSINY